MEITAKQEQSCWCGAPATYLQGIDPWVTPWDESTRTTDGEPAAYRCEEHLSESAGSAERLVPADMTPADMALVAGEAWREQRDATRGTPAYVPAPVELELAEHLNRARQLANAAGDVDDWHALGFRDSHGHAYRDAELALTNLLTRMFGADAAQELEYQLVDNGENVAYNVPVTRRHLAERTALEACGRDEHRWLAELFTTGIIRNGELDPATIVPARECAVCGELRAVVQS